MSARVCVAASLAASFHAMSARAEGSPPGADSSGRASPPANAGTDQAGR